MKILIKRLSHGLGLPSPTYATTGSAGMDLPAAQEAHLKPGDRALIPTGFSLVIPQGYEGQVRPRSGLALRHGITVLNAPGTIDCDYRGEIKVLIINLGQDPVDLTYGMRIAQLVISPVVQGVIEETDELDDTNRGGGGFGSSGI